ncbi:uncharacterized protein LOC132043810 [Lycium ferocissimum]|uniref:uncharacterized protein LOC132043810 n=1 Tax=Lycium ferocissimum TaxID=112874 RepID=UPI0028156B93|nr:uncharacterized protein LOC132043810 [Lycium ferocissimum]
MLSANKEPRRTPVTQIAPRPTSVRCDSTNFGSMQGGTATEASVQGSPKIQQQLAARKLVWSPEFEFDKEILQTIPLWVRYPKLPLSCWNPESLSQISSVLGNPLFADECTNKVERISFARVLVEIDITRELPKKITVLDLKGRTFAQRVDYDWEPLYCSQYLMVGHKCPNNEVAQPKPTKHKAAKMKQIWQNKDRADETEDSGSILVPKETNRSTEVVTPKINPPVRVDTNEQQEKSANTVPADEGPWQVVKHKSGTKNT